MGTWLLLALLGLAASTYGSLIGAGGGFIMVPVMLVLFPGDTPAVITATSLVAVLANGVSGSFAYARQRRIDYVSALTLGLATIPGSVLGAYATRLVVRGPFDALLGLVLVGLSLFLVLRQPPVLISSESRSGRVLRALTDASGVSYSYSYSRALAVLFGLGAGFIAAFFGVGGGIVLVPIMIQFLRFPPPIATATGVAVFLITAVTANVTHLLAGTLVGLYDRPAALAVGAVVGGQLGAWVSRRLRAVWLVRALALGLGLVGVRLIVNGWGDLAALIIR